MKQRYVALAILILILILIAGAVSAAAMQPGEQALLQIRWRSQIEQTQLESIGVPVFARLSGPEGPYLLAGGSPGEVEALKTQGLDVRVLDPDTRGAHFYLVSRMPGYIPPNWDDYGQVLLDDGVQLLLRTSPQNAERLVGAGVEIRTLDLKPIALTSRHDGAIPADADYNPYVEVMLSHVESSTLYQYEQWLTGIASAEIGGSPYTIATRHTHSGMPIQKATQFAYEHFEGLGLNVEYDQWAGETYPNVIATIEGQTHPDDVYVICGHLDDMPQGAVAPGADDNASGSIGTLAAADILSQYDWDCTLKFALWTGEEQGLHGSNAWAEWASTQGLNVMGVLNMDMIAYDSDSSPIIDLHARSWLPDSVALANLFSSVVNTYKLDLTPDILINNWLGDYSDNKSFWDEGYAAILAIEDHDDFTPYYHTVNDKLSTLNMPYFAESVKASIGTFAHMSNCLIHEGIGSISGYVTSTDSGTPLADVEIVLEGTQDYTFYATSDGTGYYTRTLMADTYTITAIIDGYLPVTLSGIVVPNNTAVTQNLALQPVPIITVIPSSLGTSLYTDETAIQTLWVLNSGKASLDFVLKEQSSALVLQNRPLAGPMAAELPWLSAVPISDTVPPGESTAVSITFDSTGLAPGLYQGYLDVESNDPANPLISVPVSLTVQPPCEPVEILTVTTSITGCTVQFSAALTGTAPYVYHWVMDSVGLTTTPAPTINFGMSGIYSYSLTALNCAGACFDSVSATVVATCAPPCTATEIISVSAESFGCEGVFCAELDGDPPVTYTWDFGAFGTYSDSNPVIRFGARGTYPYTLSIWSCGGRYSDTLASEVTVTCWPAYLPLIVRTPED